MTTATLILADPEALRSAAARVVTTAVPLAALALAWILAGLRALPGQRRRRRKETDDD